MGYAAARGGRAAIEAAERLLAEMRAASPAEPITAAQLTERLGLLVDRVMGEGGLWDPQLAAAALRQAEGDPIEAAHLLRAHRSTLPRFAYTVPVDADELAILRRVVPAYQQPPGPQLLGRTTDYTGRLLDTAGEPVVEPVIEPVIEPAENVAAESAGHADQPACPPDASGATADRRPTRLLDVLRQHDLVVDRRRDRACDDPEPVDITRAAVRPGAPRSARLAVMARAETGALVNLWYRNILGPDGYLHEITLGEVRHGRLPVTVTHPLTGSLVTIGHVRATEVEAIEDLDGAEEDRGRFDVGYGMCFGHNERKAIAMANLDIACHRDGGRSHLEQSVLMTTDGLEASGFLEHLKLPHYVTFRSMVERKLAVRTARGDAGPAAEPVGVITGAPAGSDCA